jgi:hypothetical protein
MSWWKAKLSPDVGGVEISRSIALLYMTSSSNRRGIRKDAEATQSKPTCPELWLRIQAVWAYVGVVVFSSVGEHHYHVVRWYDRPPLIAKTKETNQRLAASSCRVG